MRARREPAESFLAVLRAAAETTLRRDRGNAVRIVTQFAARD